MSRGRALLRPAGADDVETLARLEASCFAEPWRADELALYLGSGAVEALLLELGGEARGYALFQLLPGEAELLRIGVLPSARRDGLGGELLAGALARLAHAGRPVCHLEVAADNRPARALYERLGFRVTGLRSGYYADGRDAFRYLRNAGGAGG
jgi:ribosomal-protein-alanine N-acetyltransferase